MIPEFHILNSLVILLLKVRSSYDFDFLNLPVPQSRTKSTEIEIVGNTAPIRKDRVILFIGLIGNSAMSVFVKL